jgi:hypothetical protein
LLCIRILAREVGLIQDQLTPIGESHRREQTVVYLGLTVKLSYQPPRRAKLAGE